MGGSSQRKEKFGKGREVSEDYSHEGTAARTRPLSFDELMSKRERKKSSQNEKAGAFEDSGDHVVGNVSRDYESERGNGHSKDSSPGGQKQLVEELVKASSGKRQENNSGKDEYLNKVKKREFSSGKDEDLTEGKGRKLGDSEAKLKFKTNKETRPEAKGKTSDIIHARRRSEVQPSNNSNNAAKKDIRDLTGKDGRTGQTILKSIIEINREDRTDETIRVKRKTDARPSDASETEAGKRNSRDLVGKNVRADGSRVKSQAENKRNYQNEAEIKNRDKIDPRKLDVGKNHNLETLERKERKDLSKSRYEEQRPKRRRSRSGERKERNRRSISLSPRALKRTSYHGREHGELPLQPLKERSGRRHSGTDRSKLTSNGSSSHHRRHSGAISGLRGYSPRKRRTQAAVKTPSPTRRSPERKSAKWDLAPEGTGTTFSTSVPASNSQLANQTSSLNINEGVSAVPVMVSTIMKPFSIVPPGFLSTIKTASSIDSIQLTQATRPLRRLYVDNIPASATESAVTEFLNSILVSSGVNHIQGTQPCISCIIHKEKAQALVEFLTPEDASAALSFDGRSFSGSIIKIRRPKDFVDMATGDLERSVTAVESISDNVKDSPNKIFIGGISKALSSEMIMEIASAFGPLKAYQFLSRNGLNESYAFLEYADKSVTLRACAGLNGMKLGGRLITAVQALSNASSLEINESSSFHGIPEHAKPLLEKPSQVLKLKNVFDVEALSSLSSTEIEEVLEDVRVECTRFGTVKSVNVVKHGANPRSVSEACVIDDDMASVGTSQNLGRDETSATIEAPKEDGIDNKILEGNNDDDDDDDSAGDLMEDEPHQPGTANYEIIEGESLHYEKHSGALMEDEQCEPAIEEGGGTDDDEPAVGLMGIEPCQPGHFDSEMAAKDFICNSISDSEELPQQHHTSRDESDCLDDKFIDSIQRRDANPERKLTGEQLILEGGSGEDEIANVAGTIATTSDAVEKEESKEYEHKIFEQGSVLVEFGRSEASCVAAHSLHGRLFDDRVVEVRYIPLEIYRARFPK